MPQTLGVSVEVGRHLDLSEPGELLLAYLDYFRDATARKIGWMPQAELRSSRLPSGWTPLELVKHLTFMERRWIRWGFTGEDVTDPWGDDDSTTGRWRVDPAESTDELLAALLAQGSWTRGIVTGNALTVPARTGGRFPHGGEPPTLGWILLHVLQEYARHVGQLDVIRELSDGAIGE